MNTPWYMKKKIWIALVTAASTITAQVTGNEKLAQDIMIIGTALIGAFALEDLGKAKANIEKNS